MADTVTMHYHRFRDPVDPSVWWWWRWEDGSEQIIIDRLRPSAEAPGMLEARNPAEERIKGMTMMVPDLTFKSMIEGPVENALVGILSKARDGNVDRIVIRPNRFGKE